MNRFCCKNYCFYILQSKKKNLINPKLKLIYLFVSPTFLIFWIFQNIAMTLTSQPQLHLFATNGPLLSPVQSVSNANLVSPSLIPVSSPPMPHFPITKSRIYFIFLPPPPLPLGCSFRSPMVLIAFRLWSWNQDWDSNWLRTLFLRSKKSRTSNGINVLGALKGPKPMRPLKSADILWNAGNARRKLTNAGFAKGR